MSVADVETLNVTRGMPRGAMAAASGLREALNLNRAELRSLVRTHLGERAKCEVTISSERRALRVPFVIARGGQLHSDVFTVAISTTRFAGRGEFVPSRSMGENTALLYSRVSQIKRPWRVVELIDLIDREVLGSLGAAIDCALWDLVSKVAGRRVWSLVGAPRPTQAAPIRTISVGDATQMASAARGCLPGSIIKLKLAGECDPERVRAVRDALPAARIIVDANGSWSAETYLSSLEYLLECDVEMIEQPLSPSDDHALLDLPRPIALCADESFCADARLMSIVQIYRFVNIKLAKLGGFSAALSAAAACHDLGLGIMLGCSVSTSLSIAPLMVLSHRATYLDLDGPMFLHSDRHKSLIPNGLLEAPSRALWG